MKYLLTRKFGYLLAATITGLSLLAVPAAAVTTASGSATTVTAGSSTTTTTAGSKKSAAQASAAAKQTAEMQARLQRIIARGNTEINRRLATLKTLGSSISSSVKLTSADAASLNSTVTSDISSLTTLETKLDNDTTVADAITDAQSIITGYRVYALVVPQVRLVKAADDQQIAEGKLVALSTKLSARITALGQNNTGVGSMQTSLSDLNSRVATAQGVSSSVETGVIQLVPSDYNGNHSVLTGYHSQLQTTQTGIKAAMTDAKNIITQLEAAKKS